MKPTIHKFIFILLSLLISPMLKAETSVWKVQKGENTVYFGGTIHLLRPSDYPLPAEFMLAYNASQTVTFETDIEALKSPKLANEMLLKLSYSDQRTIKSEISTATYTQLEQYATSLGISLDFMRKAKPGMLMSTFLLLELNKIGANPEGVDAFFFELSQKHHKKMLFLETPEEQINFISEIGIGNEESFYQTMLRDVDNTQKIFISIIKYWRSGDSEQLNNEINLTMQADSPKMYQSLLVDRNNNWLPKIEAYFQTKEVEFVLVGAAHLIGADGLITRLKEKGYLVTKL